jgi:peptide/nickel transport system ATP-binding protein/oligopeptide transport system ATP-binding protein
VVSEVREASSFGVPVSEPVVDFAVVVAPPDPRLARNKHRQVLGGDVPSPSNPPSGCRFHTRCPKYVEGTCDVIDPPLEPKEGGNVAACHFPLSDEEIARRVPTAAA